DGFDIVIGNPPYVNVANIKPDSYRNLLQSKYYSARNKSDLYAFFIEKGFEILTTSGILTYIIPHTWKATDSFKNLREIILLNIAY
ncbi:MAG: Eco57I restriction-modification methylase domain-containing protein, partial [Ignavibacteria bacterium]|nr:Eco57I restriction-modification methylase domain-containing protein [Ignavibacteria bacterium]